MEQSYEGPMAFDRDQNIVGVLATEWERVSDTRVRFTIRDDVSFHSGDTMTAEDVAYSIRRLTDDEVGLSAPQSDSIGSITGVTVVDDGAAVEMEMESLNPAVFTLVAGKLNIGERSWWEERDTDEIATNINGTGPYQLDEYEEGVDLTYTRFGDYWNLEDVGDVSELTYQAASESSTRVSQLVQGETDFVTDVPPQETSRVADSDNARIEPGLTTRVMYAAMHHQREPFTSEQFRLAMNYAVDVNSIIENTLNGLGQPRSQPIPEGFVGFNSDIEPYPYDPDQAESLVEESGHAGAEIELHTPVGRYLQDVAIAEAVAGFIDQLPNVSASAKQRDFNTLVDEIIEGEPPSFFMLGWGNTTFDGSTYVKPMLTTDSYFSTYSDEEIDQLVEEAEQTGDPAERDQLYQEVSQIAHDGVPWVFLFQNFNIYGINDDVQWSPRIDEQVLVKEFEMR